MTAVPKVPARTEQHLDSLKLARKTVERLSTGALLHFAVHTAVFTSLSLHKPLSLAAGAVGALLPGMAALLTLHVFGHKSVVRNNLNALLSAVFVVTVRRPRQPPLPAVCCVASRPLLLSLSFLSWLCAHHPCLRTTPTLVT